MAKRERREWEPLFKSVVFPLFIEAGAEIHSGVQVGARELEIDLEVRCDSAAREALAETSPFDFLVDRNLFEAKLMDDRLTVPAFQRAAGRAWLYLSGERKLELDQIQTVALSSRRPRALLRWLPRTMGFDRISEGHYQVHVQPSFHILALAELPLEARNLLVALFTIGRRRMEVIEELLRRRAGALIRTAYELYPQDVKEAIRVSTTRFSMDENIRFIVEDLGRERILEEYTPEERLAGLPPEELVKGLTPEQLNRLRRLLNGGEESST